MAVLSANTSVDMTDWNFDNINSGAVTRHTSFQYFLTGLDGTRYEFTGAGLTFDGSNHLTGGTVTGFRVLDTDGDTLMTVSGFTLAGTALASAIASNDAGGAFENAIFGQGDNIINGSDLDDILTASINGDTIDAGAGNDLIIESSAGFDNVFGGDGDDTLFLDGDAAFTQFDGGAGQDTIIVDRSTNYVMALGSGSGYVNMESIIVTGAASRVTIQADDSAVAADATLHVDASQLSGVARFVFSGADADSHYDVVGSTGSDAVIGSEVSDSFHLEKGGNDRVTGSGGGDTFYMGGALTAQDRLVGGGDVDQETDKVILDGNYSAALTLGARTLIDIDEVVVQAGHNYNLITNDRNVASDATLTVFGAFLNGSDKLTFDGSAERSGSFQIVDGAGNDTLTGGAGNDTFYLTGGGHNIVNGGGGNDEFAYINTFSLSEVLDGGAGEDDLTVLQDLSAGITFTSATIANFESLTLSGFYDNVVSFDDSVVAANKTFTVDTGTNSYNVATFDGSAELDGKFILIGEDGLDTLIGGAKGDRLLGSDNADLLKGNAGQDTYAYAYATDSTGVTFDTIDGFDANADEFEMTSAVTGIDATVASGALNDLTFDDDLAAALDATHLLSQHAVLFKPTTGDHAGQTFLVVDQDGIAGYTEGSDIVIQLINSVHMGNLGTEDFVLPIA